MTPWLDKPTHRRDVVSIPIVWIAVLLSLLIHGGALFVTLKNLRDATASEPNDQDRTSSLAVQLAPKSERQPPPPAAPPPSPAPTIALAPRSAPERPARRLPPRPPSPAPPPPVIAAPRPTPAPPVPIVPPVATPPTPAPPRTTPAPPPVEGDLASYIEARRRARGEASSPASQAPESPPTETDRERLNRTVAANLGLNKTPTFGYDPRSAGGLFQIVRLEYDAADFYFLGLNKEINRNAKQMIEVRRGNAADIRIAVVRKMIAIIRDQVTGDFTWMSRRGGVTTLSARPADNAELEAYILRDIFPEYRNGP